MTRIRIGSLCTGYGGLDAGVRAAIGGELAWVADPAPGPSAILAHHHPEVPNLGDINDVDWESVEPVDILTAGFPCQPVSLAGRQAATADERWLFDDICTTIGRLVSLPRLLVFENVPGLLTAGSGSAMARVVHGLAALGYVGSWRTLRAADIGAPHRRDRGFCVARHTDDDIRVRPRGPVQTPQPNPAGSPSGAAADAPCQSEREPTDQTHTVAGVRPTRPEPGRRGVLTSADAQGHRWHKGRPKPTRQLRRSDVAECGGAAAAHTHRAGSRSELDRKPDRPETVDEHDVTDASGCVLDWGRYTAAIARWEHITGRPAPEPTEPGKNGPRLAAAFVEWLMGLPAGHVTGVSGLTRTAQLTALGNGVVPLQAATAITQLLTTTEGETS
ncbi:DNA (cytosine-5)-methyltransferase 1 [Stackebrandtia endophytica]|uniref:DNA (cytosine-5-)-methyltransferase n=1 Tax=Stackebrandtia endophytica TaxID=1496996 RepID=A0A543AWB3_9ACTN|nr:DNA (cytosine-5)-methyltransferase 1 [Stackebrandtia endophytica]